MEGKQSDVVNCNKFFFFKLVTVDLKRNCNLLWSPCTKLFNYLFHEVCFVQTDFITMYAEHTQPGRVIHLT